MNASEQLTDLKQQIITLIRSSSDRGFLPYGGCNRICHELGLCLKSQSNGIRYLVSAWVQKEEDNQADLSEQSVTGQLGISDELDTVST